MKTKIFKILGYLTLIILVIIFYHFYANPFMRIRVGSESDHFEFYFNLYSKTLSEKEFSKLMKRLIEENNDIESLGSCFYYIEDRNLCEYRSLMESKVAFLETQPFGEKWPVTISPTLIKRSSMNMFHGEIFFERFEAFKLRCEGIQ